MALQNINIGNIANDGTGDSLRIAFDKVNKNFLDIEARSTIQVEAENLGNGSGVFYNKENGVLYFKSLVAGNNITLTQSPTEIVINSAENFTIQSDNNAVNISGTGKFFGVKGSSNINTTLVGQNMTITVAGTNLVALDPAPQLSGNLDANNNDITNANNIISNNFTGNLVGTVNGVNFNETLFNLDFGGIIPSVTTGTEYVIAFTNIDYGSIITPTDINSDFGLF
jgi:hypothetical protein